MALLHNNNVYYFIDILKNFFKYFQKMTCLLYNESLYTGNTAIFPIKQETYKNKVYSLKRDVHKAARQQFSNSEFKKNGGKQGLKYLKPLFIVGRSIPKMQK
jgi:hypothetical protein